MTARQFQFEWDKAKAFSNLQKHGVSFETATTIFFDPRLLTTPDLDHSHTEERWLSIGSASNGTLLSIAYVWEEVMAQTVKIRLISARKATQSEARYYEENL